MESEFDQYVREYAIQHKDNIKITGESPEFFAEYKIKDLKRVSAKFDIQAKEILDYGTGIGNSIPFIRKYFPDSKITGLDISKLSLEYAENLHKQPDTDFIPFEGAEIPAGPDRFDLAFAACVFHHIPLDKHSDCVKHILRVLKPGGLFMIYEHNPYNPLTVRAVNTCPFDVNANLVSAGYVKKLLLNSGMVDVRCEYRVFYPGILKFLRTTEPFLTKIPLGGQYFVVGRKNS